MYYILKDGQPVPATLHEWAMWLEADADFTQRRVDVTQVGEVEISTVFLGADHNFSLQGEPLLFETLVFRGKLDGEMERYSTVEEARDGHKQMVERVNAAEAGE